MMLVQIFAPVPVVPGFILHSTFCWQKAKTDMPTPPALQCLTNKHHHQLRLVLRGTGQYKKSLYGYVRATLYTAMHSYSWLLRRPMYDSGQCSCTAVDKLSKTKKIQNKKNVHRGAHQCKQALALVCCER